MSIKNYTSSVPISRTVARIEEIISQAGAHGVLKTYDAGRLVALCFTIAVPHDNKSVNVRLPANSQAVYETLRGKVKRPRPGTLENLRDQAERTAWKLMQDWLEVQISLIQLHQADLMQVFLSYVWDGRKTFYQHLQGTGFKALMAPTH